MSFVSSTIVSDTDSTFENLNATNIYQNGNQVLDSGDTASLSVNYSSFSNSSTYWDGETSQANLNVNSSAYWDSLNSPSDITGLDSNNINDIYLFNTGDNATGNYDFDSGTLFIDSSGNYVGFGTASPSAKVDVVGTGSTTGVEIEQSGSGTSLNLLNSGSGDFLVIDTSKFVVDNAGNVGIGTASPTAKLDVSAAIRASGTTAPSAGAGLEIAGSSSLGELFAIDRTGNTALPLFIRSENITFQTDTGVANTNRMFLSSSGNLGIGTTSPSALLDVYGGAVTGNGYTTLNGNAITIFRDNNGYFYKKGSAGDLYFSVGDSGSPVTDVAMVIDDSGNVGIGTTSPSALTHIYRNLGSASTSTPVAFIEQDNSGDDQNVLEIQQDGTGDGLFIDQNGNGRGIHIDSEATSAEVLRIYGENTDRGIYFRNAGAHTGLSNNWFTVEMANSSSTTDMVRFANEGTGSGMLIDQNGNGLAIEIDSEATSVRALDVRVDAVNSAGAAFFRMDHASSTGPVMQLQQDGTGDNLLLDTNGNAISLQIDSEATNQNLLRMRSADNNNNYMADLRTDDDKRRVSLVHANDNRMIYAYRNLNSTQTAAAVAEIVNDNAGDDQHTLQLYQGGSGDIISGSRITTGDHLEFADFGAASGGTFKINAQRDGTEGYTRLSQGNSAIDQIVLRANSNVGVGTNDPQQKFHSNTTGNIAGLFESNNAFGGIALMDSSTSSTSSVAFYAQGDDLKVYTNSNNRMTIDSSGNVNINDLAGSYTGGQAYVCVTDAGTIFASDSAC